MPSRLLTNLAALASLSVKRPLAAAGWVAQPCGWRRVTEIGLKTVGSKFALATFGIDAQDLAERIAAFVRDSPNCNVRVVERDECCVGVPARDGPCFTLRTERLNGDFAKRFGPPQ